MATPVPTQLPFTSGAPAPVAESRRRRWLVRLLPVTTLLVAGVWFAPLIVAKTDLRNRVARKALANLRGSVEVGGASLGWLSPVELRDVVVKDEQGKTLLAAPKVTSAKTLLALAREQSDPGEFTVENPTVSVVCAQDGTNLERAFAEYLKDEASPSPTRTPVRLRVTGGTLALLDASSGTTTSVEGIAAHMTVPASRAEPVALQLSATTGALEVEASVGDTLAAMLKCSELPLETVAPLVSRFSPGTSAGGLLKADVRVASDKGAATVAGTLSAKHLSVSARELSAERVAFDSVELPLDVELAGSVVRVRKFDLTCDAGTLAVTGAFDPGAKLESPLAQSGLLVKADLDLAKLGALAKLLPLQGAEVRKGKLKTDLRVAQGKDAAGRVTFVAVGTAGASQLSVTAPALNGDRLELDSVALRSVDVELVGRSLRVRKFDLTSDVGSASVSGTFDPEEDAENLLARAGLVVTADVEVAKLASRLPKLLRLHDGLELREGKLSVALASKADSAGTVWEGKVETSALKAVRDGRPIAWEKPLHAEFLGRYTKGQLPTFDKFVCTSDFVALNARTTPETVQAAANVYLHKLAARLADFVDLKGVSLDGEAGVSFVGRREKDGAFRAAVTVALTNFKVVMRDGRGLSEPALKLELSATGKAPPGGVIELTTATAALTANGDELHFALVEPVTNAREMSTGSADVRLSGDLARWKARLASVVNIPQFDCTGTADVRGRAQFAKERITADKLAVTLTRPKLTRWLDLDEPSMSAVGDLVFTRANGRAEFTQLTITSLPLSVDRGTMVFEQRADGELIVSGSGPCTADLNRLGKTVGLYADPNGPQALSGRGVGPVEFRYEAGVTTFKGTLDVTAFSYGPRAKPVWTESTLHLEAEGSYSDPGDSATITRAKVERPGLTLDAQGTLAKITTTQDLNFTGTAKYDWDKLTPLARTFVSPTFTATGTGSRAFALSGQLSPVAPAKGATVFAALDGKAALGWQSVKAFGFDVGAVEFDATLARGVVSIRRIDTTFAGGKAALTPTLDLRTEAMTATCAKGAVIDRAKITSSALGKDGALRFALPAFAGALQADGEFSAAIEDNSIALGDINQTTAKGVLLIHRATVGLTPVAAQFAKFLGAEATTMTLVNDSAIPIRVEKGRVHHQNFAVRISGTTLHTNGSVGFDESLDVVVDVPLPKDLPALKNNPILQKSLAGKVLRVPVKGTLTKPDLNLDQAIAALAREGAKDAGRDLIEGELKKLFPNVPAPGANPKGGLPFALPFGKKP